MYLLNRQAGGGVHPRPSRPEGLHLQPLPERSMNLSAHSAPISETRREARCVFCSRRPRIARAGAAHHPLRQRKQLERLCRYITRRALA